jgi:hypothetical protein
LPVVAGDWYLLGVKVPSSFDKNAQMRMPSLAPFAP